MSDNGRSVLGFVVRGVELFTGSSMVLPGARAYENKAEFHRCMHILHNLGFVNLSPRSPTTVSPKFKCLSGLLTAVLEHYGLEESDAEKPSLAHGYEHFRRGSRKNRRNKDGVLSSAAASSSSRPHDGNDDASMSGSRRSTRQSAMHSHDDASERSASQRASQSAPHSVTFVETSDAAPTPAPKRRGRPPLSDRPTEYKRARLLQRLLSDPVRVALPESSDDSEEEVAFHHMMAGGLPIDPDHLDEFVEVQRTFAKDELVMVWQNERLHPARVESVRKVRCHFPPMDILWFRVHHAQWHERFDQWVTADKLVKHELAVAGLHRAGKSVEERATESAANVDIVNSSAVGSAADPDEALTPWQRRVAAGEKITADAISCILAKVYVGDTLKYYVQWRDQSASGALSPCTWEWAANLACDDLVERFEEERRCAMLNVDDEASASLSASSLARRLTLTRTNLPCAMASPPSRKRVHTHQSTPVKRARHHVLNVAAATAAAAALHHDVTISCDGELSSTNHDPASRHTMTREHVDEQSGVCAQGVEQHDMTASFVVSPWTQV